MFKISKYTHAFNSLKHGFLVYNSFTNSFIGLDKKEAAEYKKIKKDSTDLTIYDKNLVNTLIEMEVLTEKSNEDFLNKLKMESVLTRLSNKNEKKILSIAPTRECNFKCTYCYESANGLLDANEKMTKEVEEKITKHIINDYKTNKLPYEITWYGGEPMMAFDVIERITNKLKDAKVEFICGMISNGYLFNSEIIKKLELLKITRIQITIDGDKEVHNQKRMLLNGNGTFDKIIENLELLHELTSKIQIDVRINLDNKNKDTFLTTYKFLHEKLPRFKVYPAIIMSLNITDSCVNIPDCLTNSESIKFFTELYENHNFTDYDFYPPYVGCNSCCATDINYWFIGPKGELYRCWNELGVKEKEIGNILNDKINVDLLNRYLIGIEACDNSICKECFSLPICGGGCAFHRVENKYNGGNEYLCVKQKGATLEKFLEIAYEIQQKEENENPIRS